MSDKLILVSACLVGVNCRYDCQSKTNPQIVELLSQGQAVPVCPEQLGGLSTPRAPAERQGERVITIDGRDVTDNYHQGAQEALKLAKRLGIGRAILKSKSPMCGKDLIYDGQFSGKLIAGSGVLSELLSAHGILVETRD